MRQYILKKRQIFYALFYFEIKFVFSREFKFNADLRSDIFC